MRLGEVINKYLTDNGMSQRQFAKKSGMSNGYISMLINNSNPRSDKPIAPSLTALLSISHALGISIDELFEMCDDIPVDMSATRNLISLNIGRGNVKPHAYLTFPNVFTLETRKIPMLGEIACGKPIFTNEERESYIEAGTDIKADFCLKARGDSMINARILDGDIVFVRSQSAVENGDIAAVVIEGEATLKRVYYYPDSNKLILQAENPKYEPLVYIGEELDHIVILGKAISFQSPIV